MILNVFSLFSWSSLAQVSRCQAKPQRALVDEDFTSAHKLAFDMYVDLAMVLKLLIHCFPALH